MAEERRCGRHGADRRRQTGAGPLGSGRAGSASLPLGSFCAPRGCRAPGRLRGLILRAQRSVEWFVAVALLFLVCFLPCCEIISGCFLVLSKFWGPGARTDPRLPRPARTWRGVPSGKVCLTVACFMSCSPLGPLLSSAVATLKHRSPHESSAVGM